MPARELLGDMLLEMNKPGEALQAYEEDLKRHPNRFNGLYGAGLAAQKTGSTDKAIMYYRELAAIAGKADSIRPEVIIANKFSNNGNAY